LATGTGGRFLRQDERHCISSATLLAVFRITMQAISNISKNRGYDPVMSGGRPAIKEATPFGLRLAAARKDAGLTQTELADSLGTTQRVIAYWERESVGLKADQLVSIASALGVSVDSLLGLPSKPKRSGGPSGRARKLFEQVTSLPRGSQQKVLDMFETVLAGENVRRS
jgi:transcriptional regulator with XRE-family HTH domain